jgi:tetratricopeptide (TPR) repeat protein
MNRRPAAFKTAILLLATAAPVCLARAVQPPDLSTDTTLATILTRPVPLRAGIGRASESVTTSSARAQAFYNQGLAYWHSYVWIEAARSFNEALRADRNLAMAYLGLSYALGELGLPVEAREASHKADSLAERVTEREKLRITVRASQLEAAARPEDSSLRIAYRTRLDQILSKYPADVEVLLLVGQAQDPSDDSHGMDVGSRSLPFYERALALAPEYFAVHHYLTHAYENTGQMDRALAHAERYVRSADAVPHAHHMYAHVLRRVDRMSQAVEEFARADRLETAYLRTEGIPAEYDWHYRHNLNLLGTSYQYLGQMNAAEPILRRSFELKSIDSSMQELNRKDWLMLLLARDRPDEALAGARALSAGTSPLVDALGHIFASRALLSLKQLPAAAAEGNAALRQMRTLGPVGGVLVPEFELAEGDLLLQTGQTQEGRSMLRGVAAKLRAQSGPDAWIQTLFSLEAVARAARGDGDWVLAGEIADMMREYDASYAGTQYALALAAERKGDLRAAQAAFAEAVRRWSGADPDLPDRRDSSRRLALLGPGSGRSGRQ